MLFLINIYSNTYHMLFLQSLPIFNGFNTIFAVCLLFTVFIYLTDWLLLPFVLLPPRCFPFTKLQSNYLTGWSTEKCFILSARQHVVHVIVFVCVGGCRCVCVCVFVFVQLTTKGISISISNENQHKAQCRVLCVSRAFD